MSEIALFVSNRSGRIEVTIGVHVVATIYPHRESARYQILLPGYEGARLVDSVGKARRLIMHRLADWFEAAGPAFAPIAETLAAQAELEREAA
jgi:hypothetical protein